MKSLFKHMVDSVVVFVAEKYGLGSEEDVLKNEIRTLQYDYMVEKTKNMDDTLEEVKKLQEEVKKLTEEKVYLLEKEVQRLQHENQQFRQLGYSGTPQITESSFSFKDIERFSYYENYIKCILKNGLSNVSYVTEENLLQLLSNEFKDITIRLDNNHLHITYQEEGYYKGERYALNSFIPVAEIERINQISYMAKRTIY